MRQELIIFKNIHEKSKIKIQKFKITIWESISMQ